MDTQQFFNIISDANRETRSQYHVTLGELITALEGVEGNVYWNDVEGLEGPLSFDSYRGYYSDIALSDSTPPPASVLLEQAKIALETTFTGYKGGDFPADANKPLWRSEYGSASEEAIIDTRIEGNDLVLITKMVTL